MSEKRKLQKRAGFVSVGPVRGPGSRLACDRRTRAGEIYDQLDT